MVKVIRSVAYYLLVCCVPLFLIASTIRWGVNEIRLYEYGVDTYQIDRQTGIAKPELMKVYQQLTDYYNSKVNTAQVIVLLRSGEKLTIFSEKELVHLKDVKGLMQLDYTVQVVAFVSMGVCVLLLLLWLRNNWRTMVRGLLWGSLVTLGFMVLLALFSIFGFEQLFILFHLVSFTNEFWILDPNRDYLIMLFPGGFFYDVAFLGFGTVIMESLILGGTTFTALRLRGVGESHE